MRGRAVGRSPACRMSYVMDLRPDAGFDQYPAELKEVLTGRDCTHAQESSTSVRGCARHVVAGYRATLAVRLSAALRGPGLDAAVGSHGAPWCPPENRRAPWCVPEATGEHLICGAPIIRFVRCSLGLSRCDRESVCNEAGPVFRSAPRLSIGCARSSTRWGSSAKPNPPTWVPPG